MTNIISFDRIVNLDKEVISNTKKFEKDNLLIDKSIYEEYDIIYIKNELLKMFKKFKSTRYLYKSVNMSVTSNINVVSVSKGGISNPVAKIADSMFDQQVFATDFYNMVIVLSKKLTFRESVYLINTFLNNRSEESIGELLNISKTALQKYKKSCIVKMWIELEGFIKN